jgi:hypothetical protein
VIQLCEATGNGESDLVAGKNTDPEVTLAHGFTPGLQLLPPR